MAGNQRLRDALIRHQIQLQRYTKAELRAMARLLEDADKDLAKILRRRLTNAQTASGYSTARIEAMLKSIREERKLIATELSKSSSERLYALAKQEPTWYGNTINLSVGVEVEYATVPAATLRSVVTSKPFQGAILKDWWTRVARGDQDRIAAAIRLGITEGETVDQIVRRVRGSAAAGYSDGVLFRTRNDAAAVVRTAINHVSNAARDEFISANADLFEEEVWVATLDGRTTPICRARDGERYPVGEGPRPPAHFGCRSIRVAVLDGEALAGRRPSVTDTRTRRQREIDFRAQAREQGITVQEARARWAAENVGTVPASTTYEQWLRQQNAAFQDDVLGKDKGALFRRGELTLDKFVDERGKELTLEQLYARERAAFRKANVEAPA